MSDYNRATRACFVSQLRPELFEAIQHYFQEHCLGDPEAETLLCCETVSTRKSAGWLSSWLDGESDETIYTGIILTEQWLIWVCSGDKSGLLLNAARLKEIQARAYASGLTGDTGLEVCGYVEGSKGRARGYIGLGPEAAAQEFCEAVHQAISKISPPEKKGIAKWFGD
ncbi:MAG: hypothetical protein JXB07_03805 [Anaerolineae bacterium]|nr:hypothetical protein [Anaerolineae bacterium]